MDQAKAALMVTLIVMALVATWLPLASAAQVLAPVAQPPDSDIERDQDRCLSIFAKAARTYRVDPEDVLRGIFLGYINNKFTLLPDFYKPIVDVHGESCYKYILYRWGVGEWYLNRVVDYCHSGKAPAFIPTERLMLSHPFE